MLDSYDEHYCLATEACLACIPTFFCRDPVVKKVPRFVRRTDYERLLDIYTALYCRFMTKTRGPNPGRWKAFVDALPDYANDESAETARIDAVFLRRAMLSAPEHYNHWVDVANGRA